MTGSDTTTLHFRCSVSIKTDHITDMLFHTATLHLAMFVCFQWHIDVIVRDVKGLSLAAAAAAATNAPNFTR